MSGARPWWEEAGFDEVPMIPEESPRSPEEAANWIQAIDHTFEALWEEDPDEAQYWADQHEKVKEFEARK